MTVMQLDYTTNTYTIKQLHSIERCRFVIVVVLLSVSDASCASNGHRTDIRVESGREVDDDAMLHSHAELMNNTRALET